VTLKSVKFIALSAFITLSASCGEFTRQGRSPVIVVVDSLTSDDSGTLLSDVVQLVTTPAPCSENSPCQVVFNDMASVELRLILKDPGTGSTTSPSDLNSVTINRYRVEYRRTDGRNTQGVDVPYAFDSALTVNVPADGAEASFQIVRHSAKEEAPLLALRGNGTIISTIATVTFYGRDQAGNDISVSGNIGVDFGNFADESN
jgi:hypothetical protein